MEINLMGEVKARRMAKILRRTFVFLFWGALIVLCIIYRERITVDSIVELVPKNSVWSIVVMLLLYAVKSLAMFIYGGILYAASGILFSLPVAIIVNTLGTVIMTTIPFYIGRKMGKKSVDFIVQKNQKLEIIRDMQNKNEFFVSFMLRMIGLLPADLVAMYLGAAGMRYRPYFFGTVIGLFPSIICFSVMGMRIDDIGSPEFIISAAVETALTVISVILYFIWNKRKKKGTAENGGEQ